MGNVATLNYTTAAEMAYWRPQIWARKVYEEAKAKMFWNRFTGEEGSGMPVILKSELITQPGQLINISRVAELTGAGVEGEATLRGNEEKLSLAQVQVTPEWKRHAVADTGKAKKQITQDFRLKAKAGLSYWMAKKQDASMWTCGRQTGAVGFDAAAIEIVYGNNATSLDSIDSADDMGMAEIRKAAAVLAGSNTEPVSIAGMPAGEGYYLMFIHPYQAWSLKKDSDWIANHQNASERGKDNPLFTGALGEVDGVIVHSTTQCTLIQNANSPAVYTARALIVGQEALCRGLNEDITWSEQLDDYDFVEGIGIAAAWQDKVLKSKAIVQVVTSAIDPNA
jgi:N4-gp56 family major capsid protein